MQRAPAMLNWSTLLLAVSLPGLLSLYAFGDYDANVGW